MIFKNKKSQSGQAVLVVLLSLSVVLIIVLFIMSRSVTDISLSVKEEDSLRAFSAAEAGVERALVAGSTGTQTIDNATFDATVSNFAEGETEVVYPLSLKSGENATFWFSRAGDTTKFSGTQIKYCWGDPSTVVDDNAPAVEITVYYTTTPDNFTTLKVARAVLDPFDTRSNSNFFVYDSDRNCTIGSENFEFKKTLNLSSAIPTGLGITNSSVPGVLQYSTVKLLYNTSVGHKVGIDVTGNGTNILPSQGEKIVSGGTFGQSNRKVEVYQLHPETPPIFANAIFSTSGIVK